MVSLQDIMLAVNPNVPAKDLAELIAYAKANPNKLNYGSSGVGTAPHLAAELFKSKANVDMVHVPYKGSAESMMATLGGQIDLTFFAFSSALSNARSGKLRGIAVGGQHRNPALPELPSISETVPGYLEEVGNAESRTETFVALKAEVGNWRWAGVPFYLRTGKRLTERVSEIVVTFRAIPHSIFAGVSGQIQPNKLVLRLQPDEGVKLWLMNKVPGPGGLRLRQVPLDMTFADTFGGRQPEAYERLLMDVVRGNPTLFMRRDEVEAAWRWIDPILAAWSASEEGPKPYTAGSWGPGAAVALIERDGRTWNEEVV